MRDLFIQEYVVVGGGDAAVTRLPGTNSWGEPSNPDVQQVESSDDMATYTAECVGGAAGHDGASAFACVVVLVRSAMDMWENSRRRN
jgi:hypothetical protein